ncbi:MAG: type IV pilus modification protein PilV [Candidatus Competibacteraceae bacterium]|nr:type IV pilus modification protein PilV [Candidatus Competibacteraceae bacterium]
MSVISHQRFRFARLQHGFTLIEVLVTVVVLAIGLLGLAGLQATALKYNSTAYQRSQAVILAYDIIERMRANQTQGVLEYLACHLGGSCTGVAQQDIQAWNNMLGQLLPFGTADITPTGNAVTVTIRWDDSRGQDPLQEFSVRTNL